MQWRGSGFVVLSWWWLIAAIVGTGVLVIAFVDLRWGGRIMAAGFLLGAVIRLVARPARKAGGLNVRSRALDVAILTTLGIACSSRRRPSGSTTRSPGRQPACRAEQKAGRR